MKKLLVSSVLGLAALGMWASPSHAWTFGLIPHHCWLLCRGCNRCCSTICIHPYNAFSPVASGHMCFDGCCPFGCPPCAGYSPYGCPGYAPYGYPGCCPAQQDYSYLPGCAGCPTESCAPAAPAPNAPAAPAANPGAATQAMPYGAPAQAAAPYGYGPMMPQSVMPMAGQPNYWTAAYGR